MATKIRSILVGGLYIQTGLGFPSHLAPKGTIYVDSTGPIEFLSNGNGSWVQLASIFGFNLMITGGTYSNGVTTFTNSTGGTFTVSGYFTGGVNRLGTASPFVILAGTSITNGIAPPRLVSGSTGHIGTLSAPFTYTNGSDVSGSAALNGGLIPPAFAAGTPLGDAHTALLALNALTPTFSFAPGAINLSTDTTHGPIGVYIPGVYKTGTAGAASIGTAGITLSGAGEYVFQINGALTTTTTSVITLANGATADMVYWVPVGGASLGATTTFVGNLLSGPAAITTGADVNITGRLISESAVTLGGGTPLIGIPSYSSSTSVDTYVTGFTYTDNVLTILRNQGLPNLSVLVDTMTGLTVNGSINANILSAVTISATTFFGDGSNLTGISTQDTFVTGGTYSNLTGTATYMNNTGGTFSVSGFSTGATDVFATGMTLNLSNYDLTVTRNDGGSFSTNLGSLSSDVTITGGSYNINTGVVTFTNNTGGTFQVSGFTTGLTDTTISLFTYNNNLFTINDSTGGTFTALVNSFTGLTINGDLNVTGTSIINNVISTGITVTNLTATTISATTYLGLPIDIYVTGGTYTASAGTATFTNNTGGTFGVTGLFTGSTDVYVTGGTYSSTGGSATFTNNTGGTFNLTGFFTGNTDLHITAFTYNSANQFTITDNTGNTFSALFNIVTGLTVNGTLSSSLVSATTVSATTYLNLPIDVYVTGGTYSNLTGLATYTNNTGGTFDVTGFFTGGTDVYVTGGTFDQSSRIATFTNNTGGTFSVSGFSFDTYVTGFTYNNANQFTITDSTGGTFNALFNVVTGLTVTGTLLATTVSATTYLGLPIDVYVTGGTYNAGTVTYTNTTGGTFNVTGFFTGVTGATDVYVTGGTPDNTNHLYTFTNNTGGTFNVIGLTDISVTGGTLSANTLTFTNTTGGTFSVSGFVSADTYVTGFTYVNNVLTIQRNQGQPDLSVLVNTMTGLTVNNIVATGITFVNLTGNTISATTINGVTISATTYLNLPLDIRVTGGTYVSGTGVTTFTNNTGGTFNVSGGTLRSFFITRPSDVSSGTALAATLVANDRIQRDLVGATLTSNQYLEFTIPMDFISFPVDALSVDTRRNVAGANVVVTWGKSGVTDSTINVATVIATSTANVWETKSLTPGSTYLPGGRILQLITLTTPAGGGSSVGVGTIRVRYIAR